MSLDVRALQRAMTLRFYNGVSLARAVGVTPSAVYHWIHGKNQPSPECLGRVCDALGVRPEEILTED